MKPTRTWTLGAACAAIALCSSATAALAAPQLSVLPVRSWQVLAPGWSHADKELGRVDDVRQVGDRIFVAGNFTTLGTHTGMVAHRTYLAALSTTGDLLPFHVNLNGRVYAISSDGRDLYLGGSFTEVNGLRRDHLAAINLSTGRVALRLADMRVSGVVRAVVAAGSKLYIGGEFTSVAGRPRLHVARFWMRRSGYYTLGRWRPSTNGEVRDIGVDIPGRRVILAGTFTSVNGSSAQRDLAAVGLLQAGLRQWDDHPQFPILDVTIDGRILYAAEAGPGGTALSYRVDNGRQRWYYKTDGNVQAVAVYRGYPVFGMHGDWVAPARDEAMAEHGSSPRVQRHKLFMLSPSGTLEGWNPDVTSTAGVLGVWALRGTRSSVLVGGDFTAVHGVAQQRFAILRGR